MSIKKIEGNFQNYTGRVESQPLPFFRIMRVTILLSIILALIMIMLK
jgi:hypothetical protein